MKAIAILGAVLIALAIGIGKANPGPRTRVAQDRREQVDEPSTVLVQTGSVEFRLRVIEAQIRELKAQPLRKSPEAE